MKKKLLALFTAGILLTGIGCVCLYSFPSEFASKPVLVVVWVIVFYFLFDVGTSFYKDNLLFRTMTNDPNERSKLVIGPRVWTMSPGRRYVRPLQLCWLRSTNTWATITTHLPF